MQPAIGIYILNNEVYVMFIGDIQDTLLKAQANATDFQQCYFDYQQLMRIYTSKDPSKSQNAISPAQQKFYKTELLTREIRQLIGEDNKSQIGYLHEMTQLIIKLRPSYELSESDKY